ncbi:MAG: S41 family peptidase [Betaproteobacteria bacterium]
MANICTPEGEKAWVRSYMDDVYLWYNEIVDVNAASYATPSDYFDALRVKSKDKFSFSLPKAEMDARLSGSGQVGYGANYALSPDHTKMVVTYSDPNTPASAAGVVRGTQIVNVNGAALTLATLNAWAAALQPTAVGQTNSFDVLDPGASVTRKVTLSSALVTVTPVPQAQVITQSTGKKVGYLVFNVHIASAEAPLSAAIAQFALAKIDDLVLDLRDNGGGQATIAAELGAMIGGAPVTGKTFLKETFNAKHPEKTNDPSSTVAFPRTDSTGQTLPTLGLPRVFVLISGETCSASEAIINGLKPFVTVITIGATTCGKPYGWNPVANCATSYAALEVSGANSLGQGNYVNGFAPTCAAVDNFDLPLGQTNEVLLNAALSYQTTGACPASSAQAKQQIRPAQDGAPSDLLKKLLQPRHR